jgi:dihydrofolate reductase
MRTLIVTEFISLDGVVEAPGGEEGYRHSGWTFDIEQDPTMYDFKLEEAREAEVLVLGRRTYEGFSAAWPERSGEFADKLNTMPKYVVSSTLDNPSWTNTTVVSSVDDVAALRAGEGGAIQVAGSISLVQALHRAGLVDQWNLMVFPVILGSGKTLFPTDADDKQKLQLAEARTYSNGVQLQVFRAASI